MAEERPRHGNQIVGTIVSVTGHCGWGHKVGDKFEDVSVLNCGGICGAFYHDLFPWIMMLQFGGSMGRGPDPNIWELECADRTNAVKIELRRITT